MSIKVMDKVWDRYPEGGGELNLALKLADYADDDGTHIFPSIETMAAKTRQSERAVQYQIKRMIKRGWLILVANQGGGRGRAREYRISPDWLKGADLAPILAGSKGADSAPNGKGENGDIKGATDDTKGANDDAKGCKSFAPDSSGTTTEPSENRQGARRAPRIALHAELLNIDLPAWLPFDSWDMWCEHREAKEKKADVPWTRPACAVSLKKLAKLHERGLDVIAAIEESVLRGWTGIWEAKDEAVAAAAGSVPADWHKSHAGVAEQGKRFGITQKEGEVFMRFKARVVKASGPGEWMEDMLRDAARFGNEQYDALYGYFNDIPRDKSGNTDAA
ncbi:helix-turn-helix domain-containing protein [Paraburkholderia sp. EG304]|uniref:helix-turn-helix domain-containing protein n=1 Tax=Paraburkholderia sp. EG304 TaxID=3237015 RepID=UPI00397E4424